MIMMMITMIKLIIIKSSHVPPGLSAKLCCVLSSPALGRKVTFLNVVLLCTFLLEMDAVNLPWMLWKPLLSPGQLLEPGLCFAMWCPVGKWEIRGSLLLLLWSHPEEHVMANKGVESAFV